MSEKYDYFVGIDPGLSGAISVIDKKGNISIYDVPIRKIPNPNKKAKSKTKKDIDIAGIVKIFEELKGKVLVGIEFVHAMPNQGVVSVFNFGCGYGIYKGIIIANHFEIIEISPQTWKKYFKNDLEIDEITNIKKQISELRKKNKTLKGSQSKKTNKKERNALNKQIKSIAKDQSRIVAAQKFADQKDMFKLKKHDGRADASLIALYCFENYYK